MPKKTKRIIRQDTAAKEINKTNPTAAMPSARRGAEFNPDYTPIIKDLRRIGTLAGTFIIILVVLSFFLR
jgi:hypothetical protein